MDKPDPMMVIEIIPSTHGGFYAVPSNDGGVGWWGISGPAKSVPEVLRQAAAAIDAIHKIDSVGQMDALYDTP